MRTVEQESTPVSRYERRKAGTRKKLIEAARKIFGEQGIDGATIQEITDEADVGFGSFYNHFDSKEVLVTAVVTSVVTELGNAIEDHVRTLDDPVEKMAAAMASMLALARLDPVTSQFVVRVSEVHSAIADAALNLMERDLRLGLETGQFCVPDVRTAREMVFSSVLGLLRARRSGRLTADDEIHGVHLILKLLGADEKISAGLASTFRQKSPVPNADASLNVQHSRPEL